MAAMQDRLRSLLQPLNLAALFTLGSVGLSLRWVADDRAMAAWALLVAFALAFFARDLCKSARMDRLAHALSVLMPVLALVLVWLTPRLGTAQILLVIWTVVVVLEWPHTVALAAIVAVDVGVYFIVRAAGHDSPLTLVMLYAGFQGFAALCAYYAHSAERARDQLALVNADLLATRALLADSARDAERLRVARELHDVAGHKLTALALNLRALAAEPAFAAREEVRMAQQLSQELLGDIRGIVHAMRDSRGLDLGTALRALAVAMPRPRLELDIAGDVQVTDAAAAEAVLRLVQEALTNSARHADADVLTVSLRREGARLAIDVEDDGRVRGPLREGNGLSGMRERMAALGGSVAVSLTPRQALRIHASLPAVPAGSLQACSSQACSAQVRP